MVKVLIDNGHGEGSPKGSPDGKHKEWKWARAMAKRLSTRLRHYGIPSLILVPHRDDRLRETLEGKSCISKFLLQYINTPSSISANNQAEP